MKVVRQQKYCFFMALLLGVTALAMAFFYHQSKLLFPAGFLWQSANVLFIGAVVCLLSWRHSVMSWDAFVEKRDDHTAGVQDNIFDNEADFGGRNQRAFLQFNKIILPLVLLIITVAEVYLSTAVLIADSPEMAEVPGSPLISTSVMFGFALILFLAGKYTSGLAFDERHHFLRPVSAVLLLGALTMFIGAVSALAYYFGVPRVLHVFTVSSCIFSFVLGVERLLLWLMDLYRPKKQSDEYIPVYESRILGLFSHPSGVFGNLSSMLEYQFGVKVNESSFAYFFKKLFVPFVCIQLLSLFALSSITYVRPHEQAVKQSWTSVEFEKLEPGIYFTLPWPMCNIERFNVQRVQEITLNEIPPAKEDEQDHPEEAPVDIWQDEKYKSLISMVGNKSQLENPNLAAVNVLVKYRISDVLLYRSSYNHTDQALRMYSRQVLNRTLLQSDFQQILTDGLIEFSAKIKSQIIQRVEGELGVEIVDVAVINFQPPPSVAADFQAVYAATQDGARLQLEADKYAMTVIAKAEIKADKNVRTARSENVLKSMLQDVELQVFKAQRDSYRKLPLLYEEMARMNAVEEAVTKVRKFVNLTESEKEIIILELKKNSADMLDSEF